MGEKMATGLRVGPVGPSIAIPTVLGLGGLKGAVDAVKLAGEIFNMLRTIVREKLPINIYLTKEIADKIVPILEAMGVKIKLWPVEKLEPPYVIIQEIDGNVVIITADEDDKLITAVATKLEGFLDAFIKLYDEHLKKIKRRVEERVELDIEVEETEEKTEVSTQETLENIIEKTIQGLVEDQD